MYGIFSIIYIVAVILEKVHEEIKKFSREAQARQFVQLFEEIASN